MQEIINLYVVEKRSCAEIAERYGKSEWWVKDKLKKAGVVLRKPGGGLYLTDLNGKKFGKYTVVSRAKDDKYGNTRWVVRCDCGNVREVNKTALQKGQAKSCGKCRPVHNWKGVGELSGQYWKSLQHGAKKRKLKFNLPLDYAWGLYEKQDKKCALTGLDIHFCRNYGNNKGAQTASLDRVDNGKGYEIGNVRWIHKAINIMKWHFGDDYFLQLCQLVVKYNSK